MVFRNYLECEICSAVTLIRIQADDCSYPVRFTCCNCGSSMKGNVVIDEDGPGLQIKFDNCSLIKMSKPDYYLEVSHDLLTEKVRPFDIEHDEQNFSLWFKNLDLIGHEKFKKHASKINSFSEITEMEWPRIRSIIELYLNGKGELISNQVHQFLPRQQFPCNNNLERMRAVHSLIVLYIGRILPSSFLENTCKLIREEWRLFTRNNMKEYMNLANYLEDNYYLQTAEKKILKIINDFCVVSKSIEPVILLRLSDFNEFNDITNKFGLTVSDFDDLKGFYLDTYEFLADSLKIIALHNNLKYRGDFKLFSGEMNTKILEDYNKLSKGNKINYDNGSEVFSSLISGSLDNKLRNPIGHNSYEYDGLTQVIKFIDPKRPEKNKELYLIEFALICYENFISVMNIAELIYQVRKMKFIENGERTVDPRVFIDTQAKKKIGRNEPCPCGSGVKYKKCCGKVS